MRKLRIIYALFALLAVSCGRDELVENEVRRPVVPGKQSSVIIEGEDGDGQGVTTRAGSRVEFTGGYATGAGLYDGEDDATVAAVPYSGYQLVSFTGGPVGGSSSQFSGKNQYSFNIQLRDWKFTVSFKKEYTVTVSAGTGGTVSGGGKVLDGSSCTVTARANSGYSFDGWYEGSSKVSSSASYTFTVSSNRTLTAKFTTTSPLFYVKFTDEQFDERGGVDAGTLQIMGEGEAERHTSTSNTLIYALYDDGGHYPNLYIEKNSNYEFVGWYYDGSLLSSSLELSDMDLYVANITKGATILAAFKKVSGGGKYTITLHADHYDNGSWVGTVGNYVGFSSDDINHKTISKEFEYGTRVTVYGLGRNGNDDSDWQNASWWYYVNGFYTAGGTKLIGFDFNHVSASYTFTVTKNMDIYADFVYYKR